MQSAKEKYQKSAIGQRKNNFFQKPRSTPYNSDQLKYEAKSTRASESTGNDFFIKPSTKTNELSESAPKRSFDKKQWRLQNYSKKFKLDQWENRRKKIVLREYYRQIDYNEKKFDVEKIYKQYDEEDSTEITTEENDNDNNTNADNNLCQSLIVEDSSSKSYYNHKQSTGPNQKTDKRKNAFQKARDELARIKEEKRLKREEFLKRKQDKEEKLKLYRQKKAEKFKKLNKKTKRGQPVMKDRMEMLLEQIQNNM